MVYATTEKRIDGASMRDAKVCRWRGREEQEPVVPEQICMVLQTVQRRGVVYTGRSVWNVGWGV